MTREEVKKNLPIMQAFAEGKVIQFKPHLCGSWNIEYEHELPLEDLWDISRLRIKPEPKYRPFKDSEECWQEMLKHQPFGWVKAPHGYFAVTGARTDKACFGVNNNFMNYEYLYDSYTFADGTPFGIKEED